MKNTIDQQPNIDTLAESLTISGYGLTQIADVIRQDRPAARSARRKQIFLKICIEDDKHMRNNSRDVGKSTFEVAGAQGETARRWIAECTATHKTCRSREASELPTGVLKIAPLERASKWVRLHTAAPDENARYAALSYCWGGTENLITTSGNIDEHSRGINLDRIPHTIRDALIFARLLQIDLLRVDALCMV